MKKQSLTAEENGVTIPKDMAEKVERIIPTIPEVDAASKVKRTPANAIKFRISKIELKSDTPIYESEEYSVDRALDAGVISVLLLDTVYQLINNKEDNLNE